MTIIIFDFNPFQNSRWIMECMFEIEVAEPKKVEMMFRPYVNFRIKQLNLTPQCKQIEALETNVIASNRSTVSIELPEVEKYI